MKNIEPTGIFRPFKDGNIEVRTFGRNKGQTDWSIADLNETTARTPDMLAVEAFRRVHSVTSKVGVTVLYAPKPSDFNAVVCDHWELETVFSENNGYTSESPDDDEYPLSIYRGVNADGCDMPFGGGFWLSSADCPTIVAYSPTGKVICAHAGRDSLFDRRNLLEGASPREHASVVDAICGKLGVETVDSQFFWTCGIYGRNFLHPLADSRQGSTNQKIVVHLVNKWGKEIIHSEMQNGGISLTDLLTKQLVGHGVDPGNIRGDDINTYTAMEDVCDESSHHWWSCRRGAGPKRNGVLVYRY